MKGKFIKKLTACALAVSMVVSTPLTASAAEFKDFYYWSKGEDTETQTETTTVSASNTGTSTTVLKENATNIRGIKISPASLVMNVGDQEKIKAEVIYADEAETSEKDKESINKRIHWETSDYKVATVKAKKSEGMENCTITAKAAGTAKITASFDVDGDGEADFLSTINVTVKRNITEKSVLTLDFSNQHFYAGHTYELYKYAKIDGEPVLATDDIAFTMKFVTDEDKKNSKKTAVSADGVLTVDKGTKNKVDKNKKDLGPVQIEISAKYSTTVSDTDSTIAFELESDNGVPKVISLEAGVPAKKLTPSNKGKAEIDIANIYEKNSAGKYTITKPDNRKAAVTISIENKDKAQKTTDDFTWVSSNENIAKVTGINVVKDSEGYTTSVEANIVGVGVGKTKVLVTATNGAKTTFNVTVKATLLDIEAASVNNGTNTTWSGKTTPVTIKRVPAENTDKLKLFVTGISGADPKANKAIAGLVKVKNTNLVPAVDLKDGRKEIKVTLNVQSPNFKKDGIQLVSENLKRAETEITVKQSDVTFKGIARVNIKPEQLTDAINLNKKTERLNPSNKTLTYYAIGVVGTDMTDAEARDAISWESAKDTVATVNNGKVKVVGEGSAKITVSAVGKEKGKYKQIKQAFTIKSTPQCEEIVLKSNTAAGVAGTKVKLEVKQQLPKKAADAITWYIDADGNGYKSAAQLGIDTKKAATDKKLEYTIPSNTNKEIKVLATTGAVSVDATIYVVESPMKKVTITPTTDESKHVRFEKGKMLLNVGEFAVIDDAVVKVESKESNKATESIVRYDVDKNGASVVKVVKINKIAIVYGIGEGKATISAVTASGKNGKINVIVSKPTTGSN